MQSSPAVQSTRRPGPRPVRALVVPEGKLGKGCLEARAGRSREPDGELALQAVLVFQGFPDPSGLESRKESSGTRRGRKSQLGPSPPRPMELGLPNQAESPKNQLGVGSGRVE